MSPIPLTTAVALACALCSIGVVISAGEKLYAVAIYGPDGLLSWRLTRLRDVRLFRGPTGRVLDVLYRPAVFRSVLVATMLVALLSAAASLVDRPAAVLVGLTLAGLLVISLRSVYGLDGSHQMSIVVLSGVLASTLLPGDLAAQAGMVFVAAQLVWSYLVSGVAKAVSPTWRSGAALPGILSTTAYGSPRLHGLLESHPLLARWSCRLVIALEVGFVVLAVLLAHAPLALIAVGVLFHGAIALAMGLNNFFWAFTAAYPPLAYAVALVLPGG